MLGYAVNATWVEELSGNIEIFFRKLCLSPYKPKGYKKSQTTSFKKLYVITSSIFFGNPQIGTTFHDSIKCHWLL